ncbi:hypothetical protein CRG98_017751 [Punica granatum]|uniref:Lipoyl synthase N-terminal domain-containing protein n=1 Tax=Punica granatum TaxID=22663 RepID=A0A2I0K1A5_PUNGR|nr:hypothetical protein CRG98_017751 [Punica granatum]
MFAFAGVASAELRASAEKRRGLQIPPPLPPIYTHRLFSSTFTPQPPPSPQALGSQYPQTLEGLRARLAEEGQTLSDFISLQSTNSYSVEVGTKKKPLPKPKWMKESIPGGEEYVPIKRKLRKLKLHTVCEEGKRKTHLPSRIENMKSDPTQVHVVLGGPHNIVNVGTVNNSDLPGASKRDARFEVGHHRPLVRSLAAPNLPVTLLGDAAPRCRRPCWGTVGSWVALGHHHSNISNNLKGKG